MTFAMAFGVQDLQDLIRLLEQHPEWKSLLRASLLGDELLQLPAVVRELAEAQKRTEQRVGRLEEAVARLAEAQARLAEAQARTEQAVERLAQQVGRLSDVVGFTLEELARELAPAYLAERYGIRVSSLERQFFTLDDEEVEIDFYGEGTRDGERVVVIGEARSRIYGRDVESLARKAKALGPQLTGTPVPAMFGFAIHPSAREVASRTGALVIAATGKP
jgi:predicted nuclease with TOPRIM domain